LFELCLKIQDKYEHWRWLRSYRKKYEEDH
jgi:hypothetical protein